MSANTGFREILTGDWKLLVAENLPITVGGGPKGAGNSSGRYTEIIGLELDILGKPVNLRFGIGQEQARLTDIVPLAQAVCTKTIDAVLERIRSDGGRIPCSKGCSACCSSLVPLSVPEALRLKQEISAAPAYRSESMQRACFLAAWRILTQKPPKPFIGQTTEASQLGLADLNLVSSWYASLKLACPFHYKGLCTIYEQRPLACREHFVKGSARACRGGRGMAEVVQMPVQMVDALAQLASELEGTGVEAVMLPLVLSWAQENVERGKQTWPAAMMVERFVDIVKAMASKNSTAVVAQT